MCLGQIRFSTSKLRSILSEVPTATNGYMRMVSNFKTLQLKNCFIEDKKYESSSSSSIKDNKFNWFPSQKDRRKLVRLGFFKSLNDVPEELPPSVYKRFQSRLRFIQLMVFSIIFFTIVFSSHFITSSYLNRADKKREDYLNNVRAQRAALSAQK